MLRSEGIQPGALLGRQQGAARLNAPGSGRLRQGVADRPFPQQLKPSPPVAAQPVPALGLPVLLRQTLRQEIDPLLLPGIIAWSLLL